MSLPLSTRAEIQGNPVRRILKVLDLQEFIGCKFDAEDCALWFDGSPELIKSRAPNELPWGAIIIPPEVAQPDLLGASCVISNLRNSDVVDRGDVIQLSDRQNLISVMYRRRSRSNSIFVTERCNSFCVMCSQPPVDRPDPIGQVDRLIQITRLMDRDEQVLGVTGGEPTLLGDGLIRLIRQCLDSLPQTELHVLTNGRTFADGDFCSRCAAAAGSSVVWAVPLYTEAPEIHDFVVQRSGAFTETLTGLLNLAKAGQRIELRIVLQRATVPRLEQFASFISRNMPFVEHVAWMGLEPMGFARPNWKAIWVDPASYVASLNRALSTIELAGIHTSIYNLPLCALPPELHRFAARSISDWKNDFAAECGDCMKRSDCCGFFASARKDFASVKPIPFCKETSTRTESRGWRIP